MIRLPRPSSGSGPRTPGFTADASIYESGRAYRTTGRALQPGSRLLRADQPLVDYDRRWPLVFQAERRRIGAALGNKAVAIEHVGSSSVPGLRGRPEVDILLGLRSTDDIKESARFMAGLGYVTNARGSSDGWYLMSKSGPISFEVLIVEHLGPLWRRHLWFRDYLRSDPTKALTYGRLKSEWAARYGVGTEAYKEAKRRFWISVAETAMP